MRSVAILQARVTSSRLPAKVLLPIRGIPLAVLAAKRAGNTGRHVVIATSRESSDDGLVDIVEQHGLSCYRGSLDNVLERVVEALSGYDDRTMVFRLTADNVFPDGRLLDDIEADFVARGLEYLCCNGEPSGLPYGVSAEVTWLQHLRAANEAVISDDDREHVTPQVIRRFGRQYFEKYKALKKGQYRCTIDCLDDYLRVLDIFSGIDDPISVPALTLVDRLVALKDAPIATLAVTQLVLGGAQLGISYGIANRSGRPGTEECSNLVQTAITNGVAYFDTARAYGDSEEAIARSLPQGWEGRVKIVTKLSPLADCPSAASQATVSAFVDASVYRSCAALRRRSVDVMMLHRAAHLDAWQGHVWQRLLELQQAGVIQHLGVSVQSPGELHRALAETRVAFVQLPFNILDCRWQETLPELKRVKAERGLVVHARSALLQGLLLTNSPELWKRAGEPDARPVISWLTAAVEEHGRQDVADLCLAYVRSQAWVDGVVVGMESIAQLHDNIRHFCAPLLSEDALLKIDSCRPRLRENSLDPSRWKSGQSNE